MYDTHKKRASNKKYMASDKGKAVKKKYLSSAKGRASTKRYQKSEKFKAAAKKYWQSPKGKKALAKACKKYREKNHERCLEYGRLYRAKQKAAKNAINSRL